MFPALLADTGAWHRRNRRLPLLCTVVELDAEQALPTKSLLMSKGGDRSLLGYQHSLKVGLRGSFCAGAIDYGELGSMLLQY